MTINIQQQYLTLMGIDIWQLRSQNADINTIPNYRVYKLLSLQDEMVGILWLENWHEQEGDEVLQLLGAMFAAIGLQYKIVDEINKISVSSAKIMVIMGLENASKLVKLAKQELIKLQADLPIVEIYHPLVLQSEPAKKRQAWEDLRKISTLKKSA